MNARKVLEMGGGTFLISLPKDWARRNGVKKGATLAVDELSGRKLIVRPIDEVEEKAREIDIEYPGENVSNLVNEVTGAYLLGYDVIRIVGKKLMAREDRASLKASISKLVGLEIMDEDSRKITVQFLLESTAIVPEKIVRRMSGLLEGMLRDAADALSDGDAKLLAMVSERDDEVDRLYFLLVRATRAAATRPEVAEGYGLSPVDLLDYRVLASFLESVGDAVTELTSKLASGRGPRELFKQFAPCVTMLVEMNDLATRAFITRRASRQMSINAKVNALALEISDRLATIAKLPASEGAGLAEVLGALERVSKLLIDVSDLAVITRPMP